jgi:hypothetical protein
MKKLITVTLLLGLASAGSAMALPVLNANTPGAETVTVFPDHSDPNLYYTAPTVFTVSKNEAGVPNFSYIEYLTSGYRRAFIQATLRPNFTDSEMEKAKQNILAINPAARFTALPFEKASVSFTDSLKVLMVESDCQHPAGTVGDEQTCAFHLRNQGVKVLRPMLKKGLAITTQFVYTINGVRQNADGTYENQFSTYQVAGRIGGPDLAAHPELFQDYNGNTIKGVLPEINAFLAMNAEEGAGSSALTLVSSAESDSEFTQNLEWRAEVARSTPIEYNVAQDHNGRPEYGFTKLPEGGIFRFVAKPRYGEEAGGLMPKSVEVDSYLMPALAVKNDCQILRNGSVDCTTVLTELGVKVFKAVLNQGKSPFTLNVFHTFEGDKGREASFASRLTFRSEYFKTKPLTW